VLAWLRIALDLRLHGRREASVPSQALAAAHDRIDLHLDVPALPYGEIAGATIDVDARPLARPRPRCHSVAISYGDSGGFCGFRG
jgi:hypothetical protein